jgi:hypothetical protein
LRAIVGKALAPDPSRRYASAAEMQADLQAFLEHRPTAAEIERRAWSPNATIEAARACLQKVTKKLLGARRALKVAGAMAWIAAGMALSIAGTLAWQSWQTRADVRLATHRQATHRPLQTVAPLPPIRAEDLAELYAAEAGRILTNYRSSGNPALGDFDWTKAETYLARAVAMGASSNHTAGELALAKGYATIERAGGDRYSAAAKAQMLAEARADFTEAAEKMPREADPHLALARLYVYSLNDLEKALQEFTAAQRLGATMGKREVEQQADGWRMRAEREAAQRPQLAWRDAQTAKAQYERIRGFDQVEAHLIELRQLHYGVVRSAAPRGRTWR